MAPHQGSVYAIKCTMTSRIKIGWTKHETASSRLTSMQTGSPTLLELVGSLPASRDYEQRIHRLLDRYRLHGEWFKACDEVHDVAGVLAGNEPTMEVGQMVFQLLGAWRKRDV